jgi:hypothetical protein
MSVQSAQTTASKLVIIPLAPSLVAVILATDLPQTVTAAMVSQYSFWRVNIIRFQIHTQILMSVQRVHTTVNKYAIILLVRLHVPATLDTDFQMVILAMVNLLSNYRLMITDIEVNISVDIDECTEGTSGCSHICSNTEGSYICSCQSGYRLDNDNHGCRG